MKSKKLINHSKETFVSPRVTMTLGLELENELLVGSPGTEFSQSIVSNGHEIGGEYNISSTSEDYWE